MNAAQPDNVYSIKTQTRRNKQHPATPLGTLLNRYNLSLSRLEHELKNRGVTVSSTSTLSRLVNLRLGDAFAATLNPKIADFLREHLIELGQPKSEVDAQLSAVFNEGEYQPMISKRNKLTGAELDFFGLKFDPFTREPESRGEVFFPPVYREIYDACIDAIKYRHFIAVLGPIGSGKTTLRAMVEDTVAGEENIKLIWPEFFDQARISPMEIAKTILRDCDVLRPPGRSAALGQAVKQKLQSMTQNGRRVALAFDECHKMNKDAVRSLKNFFEMSSGGFQKYLGVVLLGWPTFESMLEMPEFQEIYERVHILRMPDFGSIAEDYIAHKLKIAGRKTDELFDRDAVKLICQQAETPLGCGNIANEALKISMREFGNKKVFGKAIATEMFFDTKPNQPGFKKR